MRRLQAPFAGGSVAAAAVDATTSSGARRRLSHGRSTGVGEQGRGSGAGAVEAAFEGGAHTQPRARVVDGDQARIHHVIAPIDEARAKADHDV